MPTTYPTELKVKTIRRYEKGKSIKALSEELHISQSTLYQWRKDYCSIKTPNRTYPQRNLMLSLDASKSWSIKWKSSAAPGIYPAYLCKRSLLPLKNSITSLEIRTVSMICVKPLAWQGGPSIITSFAGQTGASMRRSRLSSC